MPTVGGEIGFDPSFQENPLVNVMAVGLVAHDQIATASAKGVGNPVMVVGARTGRDGIHGASFASSELEESGERPTVQVGDPFKEKLLIEACLELIQSGVVVGIQDMGAAGLTSSSAEMAARAGSGIEMDLLKVPRREPGMTPYELMLSESQERMLVVPQQGAEEKVKAIFEKWGLEAVVVGRVTGDGMLRLYEGEKIVAEVPAASLSTDGAPVYHPDEREPEYLREIFAATLPADLEEDATGQLLSLLAEPNIANKAWIYRQFDHMVQTRTAVAPGAADAAVLRLRENGKALAATIDCNSLHCYIDPRTGAAAAVAEAARNLVCTGARPLALADGMNFGNPEKPEVFWQFRQAVLGIAEAAKALDTPVIGGNVSFYNETEGRAVLPTPIIGMVGLIDDASRHVTQGFKRPGDVILVLGESLRGAERALGGSRYLAALHGKVKGPLPELDLDLERRVQEVVSRGGRRGPDRLSSRRLRGRPRRRYRRIGPYRGCGCGVFVGDQGRVGKWGGSTRRAAVWRGVLEDRALGAPRCGRHPARAGPRERGARRPRRDSGETLRRLSHRGDPALQSPGPLGPDRCGMGRLGQ